MTDYLSFLIIVLFLAVFLVLIRYKKSRQSERLDAVNNAEESSISEGTNVVVFEDGPFSEKSICKSLINKRVKLAKKNHDKHIVSNYIKGSGHAGIEKKNDESEELYAIMPKRREWIHLGKKRYPYKNNSHEKDKASPKDSVSKNKLKLHFTILRDLKKTDPPQYINNLKKFIEDIQSDLSKKEIVVNPPQVKPIKKKEKEARPICKFDLKSNLILQEANRFLVEHFDCLFENSSFAFRGKNNSNHIPSHHDAIKKILEYKNNHSKKSIYVTECDLMKFFDTINHDVIEEKFKRLIENEKVSIPIFWKKSIEKIMKNYLNCYDFQTNVYRLNEEDSFFSDAHCEGCHFKWIDEKKLKKVYGDDLKNCKIGVPQGGALSGFIANLVLDEIDKAIKELNDPNLLYLRYCDDMIMLHTNPRKLKKALNRYLKIARKNKLFVHESERIGKYNRSFYDKKSKNPYEWGNPQNSTSNVSPWISFVGYQIGYNGEVRVRFTSIDKEKSKQRRIVLNAINQVKHANAEGCDFNINWVIKSVIHRLQGMSIGRPKLYCANNNPTLCWANGFKMLNGNVFSFSQMRSLDRNRCKYIHRMCKELKGIEKKHTSTSDEPIKKKDIPGEIIYSGKPFSYYNWLQNKDKQNEKES